MSDVSLQSKFSGVRLNGDRRVRNRRVRRVRRTAGRGPGLMAEHGGSRDRLGKRPRCQTNGHEGSIDRPGRELESKAGGGPESGAGAGPESGADAGPETGPSAAAESSAVAETRDWSRDQRSSGDRSQSRDWVRGQGPAGAGAETGTGVQSWHKRCAARGWHWNGLLPPKKLQAGSRDWRGAWSRDWRAVRSWDQRALILRQLI